MHTNRNASAIIFNSCTAIGFKANMNSCTKACQMLIHSIVNNLIDKVIKTSGSDTSYVHSRALSYSFKALKDSFANEFEGK